MRRARALAIAFVAVLALDLVFIGLLLRPGLVPAAQRQALRLADLAASVTMAAILALLLAELFRSFKAWRDAQARQQRVFDALPNALALWGSDDRLELANADFLRLYAPVASLIVPGVRFEELLRGAVGQGLVPEATGREEAWIAARVAAHRDPAAPLLRRMADGSSRRIAEQRLADGRTLSHSIDVTALVAARADAERDRRRLEDAIEALPAGFELYDADDRMIAVNSVLKSMYPRIADLFGQPLTWEELVRENLRRGGLPDVEADFEAWLQQRRVQRLACGAPRLQELAGGHWVRTYEQRTREGGIVGIRIDVSEVMQQASVLRHLNSRLDAANLELRRIAATDALTGIGNRRTFDERLASAWQGGAPLALLLLDVDHFKRYNDRHGHPAGDAVLRRVAAVLVAAVRAPDDMVARIGGEEFAVLLAHTSEDAAQRCLALLAEADIAHGDSPVAPRITASIGVALRSALPAAAAPAQLIELADTGLYQAKTQGRGRTVVGRLPA
jgi:diguanylate cyclase (GGDEF)-like protein